YRGWARAVQDAGDGSRVGLPRGGRLRLLRCRGMAAVLRVRAAEEARQRIRRLDALGRVERAVLAAAVLAGRDRGLHRPEDVLARVRVDLEIGLRADDLERVPVAVDRIGTAELAGLAAVPVVDHPVAAGLSRGGRARRGREGGCDDCEQECESDGWALQEERLG